MCYLVTKLILEKNQALEFGGNNETLVVGGAKDEDVARNLEEALATHMLSEAYLEKWRADDICMNSHLSPSQRIMFWSNNYQNLESSYERKEISKDNLANSLENSPGGDFSSLYSSLDELCINIHGTYNKEHDRQWRE